MLFPCEPRYKERDDGGELTKGLDRGHESCHLGLPIHVGSSPGALGLSHLHFRFQGPRASLRLHQEAPCGQVRLRESLKLGLQGDLPFAERFLPGAATPSIL